jgi:hypothetical protein
MCGRYYRTADKQAIAEQFHAAATTDEPLPPGYNIAPSTTQPGHGLSAEAHLHRYASIRTYKMGGERREAAAVGEETSSPKSFSP